MLPHEQTQPHIPQPWVDPYSATRPRRIDRRPSRSISCSTVLLGILVGLFLAMYFLAPIRTNVLLLGIDRAPEGTNASRTDTMILATVIPLRPYVGMLSIPRDLWVTIEGVGENRINTAHFFAEAQNPGAGPAAAMQAVRSNFGVDVHHYVRIRFDGLQAFVDALGGIEVQLPQAMSGYPAGDHRLTGEQALAFVRDRAGTDDFARMARGQLFLKAVLRQLLRPASWARLPQALGSLLSAIDSDVPIWQWPRLGLALLRAGPDGIETRVLSRDMVQPFTSTAGAAVLAPRWELINPVLLEIFGQ